MDSDFEKRLPRACARSKENAACKGGDDNKTRNAWMGVFAGTRERGPATRGQREKGLATKNTVVLGRARDRGSGWDRSLFERGELWDGRLVTRPAVRITIWGLSERVQSLLTRSTLVRAVTPPMPILH